MIAIRDPANTAGRVDALRFDEARANTTPLHQHIDDHEWGLLNEALDRAPAADIAEWCGTFAPANRGGGLPIHQIAFRHPLRQAPAGELASYQQAASALVERTARLGLIDVLNIKGRTALSLACSQNNERAGLELIRAGADVNVIRKGCRHSPP